MTVEIYAAEPGDADAVAELWVALAAGQREHGSHLRAAQNRTQIREHVAREAASDRVLLARESGEQSSERALVGFVTFRIGSGRYELDRTQGILENLYVEPDHREEGIGSRLLEAAENRLHDRGADVVVLEAMADNEQAREFYRQHGYEPFRVTFERTLGE